MRLSQEQLDRILIIMLLLIFIDLLAIAFILSPPFKVIFDFSDHGLEEHEFFMKVAQKYSESHTYINETMAAELNTTTFQCIEYSEGLAYIGKQLGYNTGIVIGCGKGEPGNRSCHAWVEVTYDLEPQDGIIKDNQDIYPVIIGRGSEIPMAKSIKCKIDPDRQEELTPQYP